MSGVIPRFGRGPVTYKVTETVKGGQLVEARAGGVVGVAAAGSTKCLGVATKDATPASTGASTDAFGNPVQSLVEVTDHVAVDNSGAYYAVTYAADAAFGVALKAAANGQVTPWVTGVDAADLIVGYCAEEAGVVVATSATGLAKIGR